MAKFESDRETIGIILQEVWPPLGQDARKIEVLPSDLHRIWRVEYADRAYIVKKYGKLPLALGCLEREKEMAKKVIPLNLTPPIIEHPSVFIQEWVVSDRTCVDFSAMECLARLHGESLTLPDQRMPAEMARYYLSLAIDDQMQERFEELSDLWRILGENPASLVPSHCDPAIEHFLSQSSRTYLIDWEYAGMAEPYWDLAVLADSLVLPIIKEQSFLDQYQRIRGGGVELSRYRFHLYRIALRFIGGCWASAALRYDHRSKSIAYLRRRALDLIS